MKLKPYPEYKDSGVEWLGQLPLDWKKTPIKHLGRLKGGAGFPHEEQGLGGEELDFHKVNALGSASTDGRLQPSENTISKLTALKLGAFLFPERTIVFAKVGAALLLGRIRELARTACIDNNMMGLVVDQRYHVSFVKYAINLVRFDLIANPGAVPSINEAQIGNFLLALPTKTEQEKIVSFLDRETAKLDTLIAKQEKLIELLQEKRQAIISHAVTKGLNPDVKMKDSGVEWLGMVPEEWNVTKIKYIADLNPKVPDWIKTTPDLICNFLPMDRIGENGECILDTEREVSDVISGYTYFQNGDVCYAKVTPCFENGKGAVFSDLKNGVGFGTTEITVFRPSEFINSELLYYIFQSDYFKSLGEASMTGAGGLKRVPDSVSANLIIAIPDFTEQVSILNKLKLMIKSVEDLIDKAKRSIELAKEHRTALISAAVTGKIDLREVN